MISENEARMLALLADVLHGKAPAPIGAAAWPDIARELAAQAVNALPADYISALGLSAEQTSRYLAEVIASRRHFHSLMRSQKGIMTALEEAGIPAVVLKGAAAAMQYPRPENRCMGDIDLLVLPEDFARTYEALIAAGCTAEETPEHFSRHIHFTTGEGELVELHNFFSTSDNAAQNTVLDDALFRAIPHRVEGQICGYSVAVLPPLENGLVLLGHINQHLRKGLGLRQIIDWMYFVEAHLDDALWENGFADMAEQIGMKRLAQVTTAMCRKYLGLQGDLHWCEDDPLCDELMEYILSHGNFGRKTENRESLVLVNLHRVRNPIRALAAAQSSGLENWKACQKHRCLRPFAWAYQLGRWTSRSIRAGVDADTVRRASSRVKKETEFLKKLGVTRVFE